MTRELRRGLLVAGLVVIIGLTAVAIGVAGIWVTSAPEPTEQAARRPTAEPSLTLEASPTAAPGVTRQQERDGLRLSVTLERDRFSSGDVLIATATIKNVGETPRFWADHGDCDWATTIVVKPSEPLEFGREWDGDLGLLKSQLLGVWGYDINPRWFVPAERLPGLAVGCIPEAEARMLLPGDSKTDELAWRAVGPLGMPLGTGTYDIIATANRVSADDPYEILGVAPSVSIPIMVEGPDVDYLDPGEAVDVVLSNVRFRELLEDVPHERWIIVSLEFRDGSWIASVPVGQEAERLRLDYTIVVEVDAITGETTDLSRD